MQQELGYEEPRFAKWLFASPAAGLIWLFVRIYFGYTWLHAGWEKVTGTTAAAGENATWAWHWGYTADSWLRSSAPLQGFLAYSLKGAAVPHAAVNYGWYASFLNWMTHPGPAGVFSKVIALGELTIGFLLIIGLFTGIAAFLAGLLTMSFGLAGVAGVNPVFFVAEVLLILAWRNAGYYGLDRWVLPAIGTPWHKGRAFQHEEGTAEHQLA